VRIRRRVQEVEIVQRKKHSCPRCLAKSVKRVSSGVWRCRRCGLTFAGGAFRPVITTTIKREIPQKPEEVVEESEEIPEQERA